MSYVQNADEWLMSEVFEPLAWRIEYRYGVRYPDIAAACYFLCVASLGLFGHVTGNVRALMVGILGAPLLTLILWPLWKRHRRLPRTMRNPHRDEWAWRTTQVLSYAALIGSLASVLASAGVAPAGSVLRIALISCTFHFAYQYFIGCNRMPPGYHERRRSPVLSLT